jgi:predicted HTH transcriptional regulator
MNKKVNQSFRRHNMKNENYLKDFFNNSSTSLSDNTLTNFCLLNLKSLDQIGDLLKAKDSANNGTSFLCGDVEKKWSITNREYQKLTLVSRKTATRDLTKLVKKGIFKLVGKGKREIKYVLLLSQNGAKMAQKIEV